jgi:Domain of unknown function (DUF6754)
MNPSERMSSSGKRQNLFLSSPNLPTLLLALAVLALAPLEAAAQGDAAVPPPAPASDLSVSDAPNDAGHALDVSWDVSADDERIDVLQGYRLMRSTGDSAFVDLVSLGPGSGSFRDPGVHPSLSYRYQLVAFGPGGQGESSVSAAASPTAQWFRLDRLSILILMLVVTIAIWLNILRAQSGKKLYIRKIAGMDAVQEAVGRATEMGQPVLYIAGIQDMDNVQTVAGLTILGSVSKMIAEYETSLLMPTSRSLVMSTARETVKESYLSAGRPDAYREDSIYYVTDEQFGFVAHVDGLMLRKKPATCFYFGAFFAESLILAETGNSIGAIQIAGTAMPTQLPFFVAACDYTLIGEELFAASAYLSQDDKMLGSLKGQDFGKAIAMISIALGSLLVTLGGVTGAQVFHGVHDWLAWLWSGG